MASYNVAEKAYLRLALHAAKYPLSIVLGFLLGTKHGSKLDITDSLPVSHGLQPLVTSLEAALQQAQIYAELNGTSVVGVYLGNELAADISVSPVAGKIGHRIDEALGGGSVVFVIDGTKLNTSNLAVVPYTNTSGTWKGLGSSSLITEATDMKGKLDKLVKEQAYSSLYDFDNHLDNVRRDWLSFSISA